MRTVLLVILVIANLGLRFSSSDLRRELMDLRATLDANTEAAEGNRARALERTSREALVARFEERLPGTRPESVDLTSLRESLLQAESWLGLDRLSLDFRALTSGAASEASNGSRIHLSSRGTFHALGAYLGRLEASGLPLAPEELRLRRESDGRVALDVRWTAQWNVEGELPAAQAARIVEWLESERDVKLERDLFLERRGDGAEPSSARGFDDPPHVVATAEGLPLEPATTGSGVPALTGFVLARPELEPDVDRRVLAALRFEGEIHLMTVGEDLGDYEITGIEALQSVTLVHAPTGERLVLYLP